MFFRNNWTEFDGVSTTGTALALIAPVETYLQLMNEYCDSTVRHTLLLMYELTLVL